MNLKLKRVLAVFAVLFCIFIFSLSAFGAEENEKSVLSVSYRGNSAEYTQNSLEAAQSAFELGADMVSLKVKRNEKGELALDEKTTLKEALLKTKENTLILDLSFEEKDEVYELTEECGRLRNVFFRIDGKNKDIISWIQSKDIKPNVIGIYKGNIVWNAISHLEDFKNISSIVQYQSKNYFNVMYGVFVSKRYSENGNPRALAPFYDKNLCGQREDNASGWNELLSRNYSIIETNNIKTLVRYIEDCEELKIELSALILKAKHENSNQYSSVSTENLNKAIKKAEEILKAEVSSLGELQGANSALISALNRLTPKNGEETQKGALNITVGKIIAAILVGLVILGAQIYVYKMQKEKRRRS